MLCGGGLLPTLEYAFDEGVYIQQARLIAAGQRIYVDFFAHQTPLHPLTLSSIARFEPQTVWIYRLPSLLALALCGVVVHRWARHSTSGAVALLAMLLFYSAPLQYFDLLALPYAAMLLASTLGLHLIWNGTRRPTAALGGVLFAVAILYKPIAVGAALATGIALLASSERRHRLVEASTGGALALAGAWLLLDAWSLGGFSELLTLQARRHVAGGGFELMRQFGDVGGTALRQGIESAREWNLREHVQTFLGPAGRVAHLPLLALAVAGQVLWWRSSGERWRRDRLLLTLSWAVPAGFSIFVWEPAFQSYFVQYLPAFSILAALFLERAWTLLARHALARGALAAAVVFTLATGALHVVERRLDPALLPERQPAGSSWLLFDPFLNYVTGTQPACGLIDPFNVYGERSLLALGAAQSFDRFHVAPEALVACLEADPGIRVGIGYFASWFVDPPLARYLAALPRERFVPMRLHFRGAGRGGRVSEARVRRPPVHSAPPTEAEP